MTRNDRQDRLAHLLQEALDLPRSQRDAFLTKACGDDNELLTEVVGLLSREEDVSGFLGAAREAIGVLTETTTGVIMDKAATTPDYSTTTFDPPVGAAKYTVQREIARGGMGVILRVTDNTLGRELAMKKVRGLESPRGKLTPVEREQLARFLEEAHITAQLDHPGIVPVHELGVDADDHPFFTMALVRGRDLGEIIKLVQQQSEVWNFTQGLGVVIKVCQAMAYAHQKGVVHRDLKPSNVMVGEFGEVQVLDWGLAKLLNSEDASQQQCTDTTATSSSPPLKTPRQQSSSAYGGDPLQTDAGTIIGTPSYMSPEQARGEIEAVGELSDVYSIGAILYELLSGCAPYLQQDMPLTPYEVIQKIQRGSPPSTHSLRPNVPPELVAICETAMATAPSDRYSSATEMASDLEAYLDQRVVRAFETGASGEHWNTDHCPYDDGPVQVYAPQHTHPHPNFSPDRSKVVFTSDRSGFAQVYEAMKP
jgi:serine/threonine protein kinase